MEKYCRQNVHVRHLSSKIEVITIKTLISMLIMEFNDRTIKFLVLNLLRSDLLISNHHT